MKVSPENSGVVRVDGQTASSYPISCGQGSSVRVEAVPASGYVFSHWAGDMNGTTNPNVVKMIYDKSVTAVFTPVSTGTR